MFKPGDRVRLIACPAALGTVTSVYVWAKRIVVFFDAPYLLPVDLFKLHTRSYEMSRYELLDPLEELAECSK